MLMQAAKRARQEDYEVVTEESSLVESVNDRSVEIDVEEESALEFIKQWQPSPKKERPTPSGLEDRLNE